MNYQYDYEEIELFRRVSLVTALNNLIDKAKNEVKSASKLELHIPIDYTFRVYNKHSMKSLSIDIDSRLVEALPDLSVQRQDIFGEHYVQTVKDFFVSYKFEGDGNVLTYQPSTYSYSSSDRGRLYYFSSSKKRLGCRIQTLTLDSDQFENEIKAHFDKIFINIVNFNADIETFNNRLKLTIDEAVRGRVRELDEELNFLSKLNKG